MIPSLRCFLHRDKHLPPLLLLLLALYLRLPPRLPWLWFLPSHFYLPYMIISCASTPIFGTILRTSSLGLCRRRLCRENDVSVRQHHSSHPIPIYLPSFLPLLRTPTRYILMPFKSSPTKLTLAERIVLNTPTKLTSTKLFELNTPEMSLLCCRFVVCDLVLQVGKDGV